MTEFNDSLPPVEAGQPKSNRNLIIAIVVGVVVLCCCCLLVVGAGALWSCGDMLLGISTECAPLF